MASYSVATTKDNLSALIDQASAGKEVVITRRGKAAAKLVPVEVPRVQNRRAATELLRQRIAKHTPISVPVDRFYDWLYVDDRI